MNVRVVCIFGLDNGNGKCKTFPKELNLQHSSHAINSLAYN